MQLLLVAKHVDKHTLSGIFKLHNYLVFWQSFLIAALATKLWHSLQTIFSDFFINKITKVLHSAMNEDNLVKTFSLLPIV